MSIGTGLPTGLSATDPAAITAPTLKLTVAERLNALEGVKAQHQKALEQTDRILGRLAAQVNTLRAELGLPEVDLYNE